MKITVEIGPNKVTRLCSKLRYSIKGFKTSWREYGGVNRDRTTTGKAAKKAA